MTTHPKPHIGLVVIDLDNTIWDWFAAWHASFSAMLAELVAESGIPLETLKSEIKSVHVARGTSEYSFLLEELPSITALRGDKPVRDVFDSAVHAQNSKRLHTTRLYPGALVALQQIKARGVQVIAYTESLQYWTEWRIRMTGLDGVIDVLYSSPDHDFPIGVTPQDVRTQSPELYEIKRTVHRTVDRGVVKPDPRILNEIIREHGQVDGEILYIGDSLDKDVAMAQAVGGVIDVHAKYGEAFRRPEYALLQELSHWPKSEIEHEVAAGKRAHPTPTYVLKSGFGELLDLFTFGSEFDPVVHTELWKKSVDVQMHFNDIGWRIRALALTALTFVLGATGYVFANTPPVDLGFWRWSVSSIVPVVGLLIWWSFWFMDAKWFHRLLVGSVQDGDRLEKLLNQHRVRVGLGDSISNESPISAWPFRRVRRSSDRLNLFYKVIGWALLGLVALILSLGFLPKASSNGPDVVVNNVMPSAPMAHPTAPMATPSQTSAP